MDEEPESQSECATDVGLIIVRRNYVNHVYLFSGAIGSGWDGPRVSS